jgi:hypothetical protein
MHCMPQRVIRRNHFCPSCQRLNLLTPSREP